MAKRKTEAAPSEAPAAPQSYTVLARRYRPQQFGDLVGQEAVAEALVNALQSGRVAHAYLFTGARGVGKTSTARILAKALNCEKGPTPTPCDACEVCRSIAAGEDVDVLEIDGASNRGIDEVREIRQNVQYRPGRAKHKIYIIDEVHMLTPAAFNALLKTLEEPPPHVKFIFATTEVQKIPVTILSRCQRFDFSGIGTPRIVERLKEIVSSEGLKADEEAIELIARRGGGSMRDAQSLLDQLLAFSGDGLTAAQVHRLLGTAQADRVADLAGAVLAREPGRALDLLAVMADQGLQLGELVDQLIDYWRDLMVVHASGQAEQALSVTGEQREALRKQAAALRLDTILAGLDVLVSAKARLKFSGHDRVLLEMALVRLGRLDDLASLAQVAQWLRNPQLAPPAPAAGTSAAPRAALPATRLADEAKKKATGAEDSAPPARVALTPETVHEVWERVLYLVGPMLANDLRRVDSVAISGPNALVIRFPTRYNSSRDHCQEPSQAGRIEAALVKVTGRNWGLRVESGGGDGQAEPAPAAPGQRKGQPDLLDAPLLKHAADVLGAQVVRMDADFGAVAAPTPSDPANDGNDEE